MTPRAANVPSQGAAGAPQSATPPAVRELLWRCRFKAHVNVRYFTNLHRWYAVGARWSALSAALTACATVAGLKVWEQHPTIWTSVTAATAVLGVVSAVLNFPKESETLADLRAKWVVSQQRWDRAWAEAASVPASVAIVEKLQRAEADLEEKGSAFPTWSRLVDRAQDEACDALGIERKRKK